MTAIRISNTSGAAAGATSPARRLNQKHWPTTALTTASAPSTRIPPTKITGFAEYRFNPKWKVRVQGMYSGDRDPDSTQYGGQEVKSYKLLDVQSTFQLPRGTLQLSVDNITNEQYFPVISQAAGTTYSHAAGPGARIAAFYAIDW